MTSFTKHQYLDYLRSKVEALGYELVDDSIYGTHLQVKDKNGELHFIEKPQLESELP